MDEELYDFARENDLDYGEAEEVQELAEEEGIDLDDAYDIWQEL